jgi:hypothetical protein
VKYCFNHHGGKNSLARNNVSNNWQLSHASENHCQTTKGWFLQEPHGVTSQKKAFFVTAVQTSNLSYL